MSWQDQPFGISVSVLNDLASRTQPGSSTWDVLHSIVLPATHGGSVPFASLFAGRVDADGRLLVSPPTVFVSHPWRASFHDLVEVVRRHAQHEPDVHYWIDVLCLKQDSAVGGTRNSDSEDSLDDSWRSGEHLQHVMRQTPTFLLVVSQILDFPLCFSRTWCLYELLLAVELDMEMLFEMPEGEMSAFDARLQDVFERLLHRLDSISLEASETTHPEDKHAILSRLSGGALDASCRATEQRQLNASNQALRRETLSWFLGVCEQALDIQLHGEQPHGIAPEFPSIFFTSGAHVWRQIGDEEAAKEYEARAASYPSQ